LTLRPARPDDAPALGAMFESLPPHDRRMRFHGAVNAIPPALLAAWTSVSADDGAAFVVTARIDGREQLIAEARYVIDDTTTAAEIAIAVGAPWRRMQIGLRCLEALRETASRHGLEWLYAHVLAENAPMLALLSHAGFAITRQRGAYG